MKRKNTDKLINNARHSGNFMLMFSSFALSFIGIVMQFSASYYTSLSSTSHDPYQYLKKSVIFAIAGIVVFIVCTFIPINFVRKYSVFLPIIGIILLAVVVFTPWGKTYNNGGRWIEIPGISFLSIMPGEIMKTVIIIFFSAYYSDKKDRVNTIKGNIFTFVFVVIISVLIMLQPNFSTLLICLMLLALIMFLAGLSIKVLVLFITAGSSLLVTVLVLFDKFDYILSRIVNFWNPFLDETDTGYQVVQGLRALGTGGLFGTGLGNSVQKAYYLPSAINDFILCIIGEEFGFVGILLLIALYFALIVSIFKTSLRAPDRYSSILAAAVGCHVGIQLLMSVAIVSASMPCTGVTLPLISYGGNSIILFMAEFGLVFNISKNTGQVDDLLLE